MRISVVGAAKCSESIYNEAVELGRLLAQKGHVIFCGGKSGVMEAVAKGAKIGGGISFGILPGRDIEEANKYITYPILTGLGEMRNFVVVLNGDVIVAVSGGYGTLSEIALAKKIGKPVIVLGKWQCIDGVIVAQDVFQVIKLIDDIQLNGVMVP